MKILKEYETHHFVEEWNKADMFCPKCGQREVHHNTDGGDFYVGEAHLCVACNHLFTIQGPSLVTNERNLKIIRQLLKQETDSPITPHATSNMPGFLKDLGWQMGIQDLKAGVPRKWERKIGDDLKDKIKRGEIKLPKLDMGLVTRKEIVPREDIKVCSFDPGSGDYTWTIPAGYEIDKGKLVKKKDQGGKL